jgi:hypothetical protein
VSASDDEYAQVGEESESDIGEAKGVEALEAPESISPEEAKHADERVLAEVEELAGRGELEAAEDLFEREAGEGLTGSSAALRLTPHFRLSEFHCNDPQRTPVPAIGVPPLRRLARDVLEPMRAKFGVCTVWSGFRTDRRNAEVGGAPSSWHQYHRHGGLGVASDVTFARGTPREWANEAERLLPNGGVGRYPTFVHVDNRPTRARWGRN